MSIQKVVIEGMTVPMFLRRGDVLRLMRLTGSGARRTFDKWTQGENPLLPDVRPVGCGQARYRRSDVLRAIQPAPVKATTNHS